jgi:hypothetical protein
MYDASLREPQAFLRPRPVRVAYLVEEGEYTHEILDAIFADCHGRWGGRYSLVIPCEAGSPQPAYLPWLRAYDPDIIYSYVDLDAAKVKWLHEALGPSYLIKHESYDHGTRDRRYFRPELPLECLTALSVAPQYARAFPASAPQPMLVVDSVPGQPHDRFVDDNFGSYAESFGRWPVPEHLADVIRPLTIAAEELLRDPRRWFRLDGETVPNTVALLRYMATERNSFGVAQLAADSTPRIEICDRFTDAFTLIVGDTSSVIAWSSGTTAAWFLPILERISRRLSCRRPSWKIQTFSLLSLNSSRSATASNDPAGHLGSIYGLPAYQLASLRPSGTAFRLLIDGTAIRWLLS